MSETLILLDSETGNLPLPRSDEPRILVLANQKGGVGKTTTAINLGTALAQAGRRILLIDFDPQGNASTGLGIPRQARRITSYDVLLGGRPLATAVIETAVPRLFLVPASVEMTGAEVELVGVGRREYRLRDALSGPKPRYDFILIDCPPSLGLLTLNALVAADAVIVPLQCEFYALEGLSHLMRTIERVRRGLNPKLEIAGVLLTMFDRRNNLSEMVAFDVREHFGDKVYETAIPRNVRVSEAPSHGAPVMTYDARSAGALAYARLAEELMKREETRNSHLSNPT